MLGVRRPAWAMKTLKCDFGISGLGFVLISGAGIFLGMVLVDWSDPYSSRELLWTFAVVSGILFIGGLALISIAHRCYLWVGERTFGFASKWPFEPIYYSEEIDSFLGIVCVGGSPGLLVKGRGPVPVPEALHNKLWELQSILLGRQGRSLELDDLRGFVGESIPPGECPPEFRFEGEGVGKPRGTPLADLDPEQPDSLRQLIHQYEASAIFWEAYPPAFELVKVLMGLKRSNGGLILIGVHPSARVVGLSEEEFAKAKTRMMRTACEMTNARVEIGRLDLAGKIVLFAIFNATAENMAAIGCFQKVASEVAVV